MAEETKNYFQIVVVGEGGVGKSTFTIRFVQNTFCDEYDPTIEDCYRFQANVDDIPSMLDIYDTAGQEEYTHVSNIALQQSDAAFLVFSLTNELSFQKISNHLNRVKDYKGESIALMLIGTKSDLISERVVTSEQITNFLQVNEGLKYMETSAKTGENVLESFEEMIRMIRKLKYKEAPQKTKKGRRLSSAPKISNNDNGKSKKNCTLI